MSRRPDKVQELMDLITNNKKFYDIIQVIYNQDIIFFTHHLHEKIEIKKNYLDLGYNINSFKFKVKVAVKF